MAAEAAPLLAREDGTAEGAGRGGATWAQTLGNVVVSIVGTGVLGLPYAFRTAGWLAGSLGVAAAGCATLYCMLLLVSTHRTLAILHHAPTAVYVHHAQLPYLFTLHPSSFTLALCDLLFFSTHCIYASFRHFFWSCYNLQRIQYIQIGTSCSLKILCHSCLTSVYCDSHPETLTISLTHAHERG
jgi:hypothetical protein